MAQNMGYKAGEMNIEKFKKIYGLNIYPYTDYENENEITIVILESGRFFFLGSVVTDIYRVGKHLAIANRNGHETYSTVKEIYNLKKDTVSKEWDKIKHLYGKEWISGRGYGTRAVNPFNKNMAELFKGEIDYIPEKSDCPQK